MPLTNEQLVALSRMLTEALEVVLYAYDKDIVVDDELVEQLRRVHKGARELVPE